MKFIDEICNSIVSPPKIRYSTYDLGSALTNQGKRYDFQTLNNKGEIIVGSYYESSQKRIEPAICLIYLHSMNGSRLESTLYAEFVMKLGISFCNFDFTGCGNSEGESISFGATEKNDILAVIEKLRDKFKINKFLLWGRSMGSVCAIKYCEMINDLNWVSYQHQIIGIILDSSFKSFAQLVIEIAHTQSKVPQFLIKAGYYLIKGTIEDRGGFQMHELEIQSIIHKIQVPVLFLASQEDTTVHYTHSKDLFDKYTFANKQLFYINGLHNQSRDEAYLHKVKEFIERCMMEQNIRMKRNYKRQNKHYKSYGKQMINSKYDSFQHERYLQFEVDEFTTKDTDCHCSLFSSNSKHHSKDDSNSQHHSKDDSSNKHHNNSKDDSNSQHHNNSKDDSNSQHHNNNRKGDGNNQILKTEKSSPSLLRSTTQRRYSQPFLLKDVKSLQPQVSHFQSIQLINETASYQTI